MTRERDIDGLIYYITEDDRTEMLDATITVRATKNKRGKTISFQTANIMLLIPVEHVDDMIDIVDGETKGDYVVVKVNEDKTVEAFVKWESGAAIIATADKAMIFEYKSKAEEIAEELGDGWRAVDINPAERRKIKRLMAKIMRDDEEGE